MLAGILEDFFTNQNPLLYARLHLGSFVLGVGFGWCSFLWPSYNIIFCSFSGMVWFVVSIRL